MYNYFKFWILVIFWLLSCNNNINDQSFELQSERDKHLITSFLEENNIAAEEHESGYFFKVLESGTGDMPAVNDTVTVHYKGNTLYNDVFDNSRIRDKPFTVILGVSQVIVGWHLAISEMRKNEKTIFYFPSNLGYGTSGFQNTIPSNAVLVFEIELLTINRKQ